MMMCLFMFWLMKLIIAARVELLPEPVTPVTSTSPRLTAESFSSCSRGRQRSSKVNRARLMVRSTKNRYPRWDEMLTRKRTTLGRS